MRKYVNVREEPTGNLIEGWDFRLKAYLEKAGYLREGYIIKSLAKLSRETGVPVQNLRNYIYKGEMPAKLHANAIAGYLDVRVEKIFRDSREDIESSEDSGDPHFVLLDGTGWRKIQRELGTDIESVIEEIEDPDKEARRHEETCSLLRRIIKQAGLTYQEREIVTMLYVQEMPEEEIGEIFKLTPSAVSCIGGTAKKKLKDFGKRLSQKQERSRELVPV